VSAAPDNTVTSAAPATGQSQSPRHVTHRLNGALATVTLTNPPQNRLTIQFGEELAEAADTITRSDARAVLLTAEGDDFSWGGDFVPWADLSPRELRATFERYWSAYEQFEKLPIPVVAAVQGLCFGGGFELALRADVIFAAETARFGHPEQSLGILTLMGGIQRVAERAGRARAMEWAMTSEKVPARTMREAGVINRVVPDERLRIEAEAFARRLASGPTLAHAAHKALVRAWATGGMAAADRELFDLAIPLFASEDVQEGLASATAALRAGRPRPTLDFQGR